MNGGDHQMLVSEQLQVAMNAHDVDALAALFAEDYRSEQPAHPGREFVGREQVRTNWTAVFAGVPDFAADLTALSITADGVELAEWRWHGHHADDAVFEMRGTTVLGIVDSKIAWGRLYMEPVDQQAESIDEMVEATYRPGAEAEDA